MTPTGRGNPKESDPPHELTPPSNCEITKDEDIEAGSSPSCRICLQSQSENDERLISPCMCKGTLQFVHRSCLDRWRSIKEGFAFSHCTTCKAQFHLRVAKLEDNPWHKVFIARDVCLAFLAVQITVIAIGGFLYILDEDESVWLSHSWDHIHSKHPVLFYYCVGVIYFFVLLGMWGVVLHCGDPNYHDPRLPCCEHCSYGCGILDYFPRTMETLVGLLFLLVAAILGIAYSLIAVILAIQRTWQRFHHILTNRVLTQEYIVEDLRGCYTSPKLDPKHEERLKRLNLWGDEPTSA
ncbi:hypothetical protein ACJIZ3_021153 [Penstemon smallii]|uniref:RING-CH-type domain-containing protein n=1 Tax=Penstemon smallii TaxID=265156 RepID=A0ABD3SKM5_9LAMI